MHRRVPNSLPRLAMTGDAHPPPGAGWNPHSWLEADDAALPPQSGFQRPSWSRAGVGPHSGQVVVVSPDPFDMPLGRALHCLGGSGGDRVAEVADDRIEPQAGQVIGDAAHDLRREREIMRISTHETHGGAIWVREDGVGAEQQAAALGTLGQVCNGGAGKVATDAVQSPSRGDLAGVLPELD